MGRAVYLQVSDIMVAQRGSLLLKEGSYPRVLMQIGDVFIILGKGARFHTTQPILLLVCLL